jgi:hypothetical protein
VLVILPSEFDEPDVPLALQFQDAKVPEFKFDLLSAPTVNPSVPKAVKPSV